MANIASHSPIDELPHLLVLPEQEEEVQILALAYALGAGYQAHQMNKVLSAPSFVLDALATEGVQKFLSVEVDGKRGTNDVSTYQAIFIDVIKRAYPATRDLLQRDPSVLKHLETFVFNSPAYRYELYRAAMANREALLTTPETDPLVLIWPLLV